MKLIECVPNFSEGKDKSILDAIAKSIEEVNDVKLLDVDSGSATNRTVFTFVGTPVAIKIAAFNSIKTASMLIDMRKHKGEHPRIGATDVCPFIPISEVSIEECVEIAREVAQMVGDKLQIPVYLYEYAATFPQRKNLADIRKGEYEGLEEKIKLKEWKPDFGPKTFNEKSGATVIGVRDFLIAYNVNLNTKDKKLANEIAFNIREQGRAKRDKNGNIIRNENGESIKILGILKSVKAVGWVIEEYNRAQVSINLTNYKITPTHIAFEECVKEAEKIGVRVTGSEIIGLIPKDAMLETGKFYLNKQNKSTGIPEKEIIEIAIQSLGLNDVTKFDPKKKIIEYVLEENIKSLNNFSVNDFIDELSTDSPAPGGGSVAALLGAISSALSSMVANLTFGKKGYEKYFDRMKNLSEEFQKLKSEFLFLVDEDTNAFNKVMDAVRLPKKNEKEILLRNNAIEEATKYAAIVPLNTMEKSLETLHLTKLVAKYGNKNSASDSGVAALCLNSAIGGAQMNVEINLKNLSDKKFCYEMKNKVENIVKENRKLQKEIRKILSKVI